MAVAIGIPVAACNSRVEAIAVATGLNPIAVIPQPRIKDRIRVALIAGSAWRRRSVGHEWFAFSLWVRNKANSTAIVASSVPDDNAVVVNAVGDVQRAEPRRRQINRQAIQIIELAVTKKERVFIGRAVAFANNLAVVVDRTCVARLVVPRQKSQVLQLVRVKEGVRDSVLSFAISDDFAFFVNRQCLTVLTA